VCAAVALEALRIYQEPEFLAHVRDVGGYLQNALRERFSKHPLVGEIRGIGLLGALELVRNRDTHESFDASLKVPAYISGVAQEKGLMTRPLNNCVVFAPPLIVERKHIDLAIEVYSESLDQTLEWLRASGHVR